MKHSHMWWKLGFPETIYALMNVGRTWWKAIPTGSGILLAPHSVYANVIFLNGHRLKFCGRDSYNSCNSCWNNHFYIIMCLSVVCPSHIGCCVVKGYHQMGSGLLPAPQPLYATAKKYKMAIYIKSTVLKLEKTKNVLEILLLYILNMLSFKRLALIAIEI